MIVPFLLVFTAVGASVLLASIAKSHLVARLANDHAQRVVEQVEVLERCGRTMSEHDLDRALHCCTEAVVELGFDAAWLLFDGDGTPAVSVGDWRCVAPTHAITAVDDLFSSDPGDVLITTWKHGSPSIEHSSKVVLHSASVVLARHWSMGAGVLVGWATEPISGASADCFGALARHGARALAFDDEVLDLRNPHDGFAQVERVDKKVARSPSF